MMDSEEMKKGGFGAFAARFPTRRAAGQATPVPEEPAKTSPAADQPAATDPAAVDETPRHDVPR